METLEMITKALEAVVEQKVAEKAGATTLDSVFEFIKTASPEDISKIFNAVQETEKGDEMLHEFYQNRLEEDDSVIAKDDIDVDVVDDCGLLEDCYNRYIENAYDLRDIAKDIIDRI